MVVKMDDLKVFWRVAEMAAWWESTKAA